MIDAMGSVTVHHRRDGRICYRARLTIHGQRISLGLHDTAEQAERAIDRAVARLRPTRAPTLATWGPKWLDRRETDGHHRGVVIERSVWAVRVATAHFYRTPLRKLRRTDFVRWVAALCRTEALAVTTSPRTGETTRQGKGSRLSRSSVLKALALVRRCLSDAADEGLIAVNPALGVQVPRQATTVEPWTYLTEDEIAAVLGWDGLRADQRAILAVAIYQGLRAGETWGLRWADVTLGGARPELVVRHSYRGPTKGGRVRRVPLLAPARAALREWARLHPGVGHALVFPAHGGGCHASGYDAGWPRVCRETVGRRVRFHDLRHTCASHLVMGTWGRVWGLIQVRDFLGHSSIVTTQRYAHLSPGGLHDMAAGTAANGHRADTGHGEH